MCVCASLSLSMCVSPPFLGSILSCLSLMFVVPWLPESAAPKPGAHCFCVASLSFGTLSLIYLIHLIHLILLVIHLFI